MNRGLPAFLAIVVAVVAAGCGGQTSVRSGAGANAGQGASVAAHGRSLVFYAKPKRAQFINHADDRARGDKASAFNADELPTPPNANSGKKGARAGDDALFSLTLYTDAGLKRAVGTAIYTCTFNFAQEATCEADFEFGTGTMIAMGPAKPDGSVIVLPVTAGTGRYQGAHGQVTSSPSGAKNTQIIRFLLA